MLGWLVSNAIIATANIAKTYAIVPVCGYIAAHIGTYVGTQACRKVYRVGMDKLRGVVTVTLRRSRIYIINNGVTMEVDPRRKYIIERGEIRVLDGTYGDLEFLNSDEEHYNEFNGDRGSDIPMVRLPINDDWISI